MSNADAARLLFCSLSRRRASDLVSDIARDLIMNLDTALASEHVDDIELMLVRDLVDALDLDDILSRDVAHTREFANRVAHTLNRRIGLGADAVDCLQSVRANAGALVVALSTFAEVHGPRPAAVSLRLTSWALRFLPVGDRAEYAELFHSELLDLRCGWWGQVRYSLRVLFRAPLLRHELRLAPPAVRERA
jgi:hypothetical protein